MTSKEAIQSVKDYVLAGNNVATSAVAEVPPTTEDKKEEGEV